MFPGVESDVFAASIDPESFGASSLCTDRDQMRHCLIDTNDLRTLLEGLYPDVHISATGMALLAAQISQLQNHCDILHNRIQQRVHNPVPLTPTIQPRYNHGTNDYSK